MCFCLLRGVLMDACSGLFCDQGAGSWARRVGDV